MRVVSHVRQLTEDLEWSHEDLARALSIQPPSAKKLIDDDHTFRLGRKTLHKLMLLAFENGYEQGPFEVRHHEIWDTFQGAPATIYRVNDTWDARVEGRFRQFLAHLDCVPELGNAQGTLSAIEATMRSTNCVFIGSPKANPASELALALLCQAKPFDSTAGNRRRMPFQLLGKTERHKQVGSAVLAPGTWTGITVGATRRNRVRVDWLPEEVFWGRSTETGQDAAAVVACRQRVGTEAPVTSIVISGYTGLATEQAAEALIRGEPPISLEQLQDLGHPATAIYAFKFKKRSYRGNRRIKEVRRILPDSGHWYPPW